VRVSATRRWLAPRTDGAILADPPLNRAGELLARNRALFGAVNLSILGRPLAELRALARHETLQAAADYLSQAGEPVPPTPSTSLVLGGHQPDLFHPGVWVKNFALNGIARRHAATPVNLVVDNDTAKATAIRVPTARPGQSLDVQLATVPFDHYTGETPFEERPVRDEAIFANFAERVADALHPWKLQPLLPGFWAEVRRQAKRTPLLGERLVAARRALEREWGCHNLEVPVSAICRTETFAWFAGHILSDLPRFHATYNATVRAYRQRNRVRSRNHPVPDLADEFDWLEVPFWGWRAGQTQRSRLFARAAMNTIELRAGSEVWPALKRPGHLLSDWVALERRGFKVRTRALTTTLFSRLFLADLFIHGIGGGKYDELTDDLLQAFYGLKPPGYMVLSATLHLPIPALPARPDDQLRLARLLRDLHYNPQRHLPENASPGSRARDLSAEKQRWIDRSPEDAGGKRERFQVLRSLNLRLEPFVQEQEVATRDQLSEAHWQLHANAILQRRDYAFCLFPEEKLRPFCNRFLRLEE